MNAAALATAFGLIFLAELPDKTAYTVLLLAARSRPVPVLLGAWAAFALQTGIAFVAGRLVARLPPFVVMVAAGLLFLGFGIALLLGREEEADVEPPPARSAFLTTFSLVAIAEMGDATQVGTAALVAGSKAPLATLAGSFLALCSVAALAVTVGRALGPRLPRKRVRRIAGGFFCLFGVVSLLRAFLPG